MKLKILAAFTAAVLSMTAVDCGALAENTPAKNASVAYHESATAFAEELHKDVPPQRLFAHHGGVIDYFVTRDNVIDYKEPPPKWFHSIDNGKTWESKDMTWAYTDSKTVPEGNEYVDFYVTGSGDFYFIQEDGSKTVDQGNTTIGFPMHKVYKCVNGKAQAIPNIQLADPDYGGYGIAGINKNGTITIVEVISTETSGSTYFSTYDLDTGELKKKVKCPNDNFIYRCYADGIAYGIDYLTNDPQWKLSAYRTDDAKQVFSIPYPGPGGNFLSVDSLSVQNDGTLYIVSPQGLYRLPAGSETPVKLLDASASILGRTDVVCRSSAVSEDGVVYIPTYFLKAGKDGSTYSGDGKLYCLSPVAK